LDKIQELEKKLKTASNEEKVDILNHIASSVYNAEPEKTEQRAREALALAEKIDSEKGIAKSCNNIGISFHRRGNYDKAIEFYLKALKIFEKMGDKNNIAGPKNNIGAIYEKQGNYDLALKFHFEALKAWEEMNDKNHLSVSLNNIGIIYEKQGRYDEALECHLKALKINEEIGNKQNIAASYKNIGNIYGDKQVDDKAMEYFQKAKELFEETGDKYGLISSCTSLGIMYTRLKNYDLAHEYLEKSVELAHEFKAKGLEINAIKSFSRLYEEQENFEQALQYYKNFTDLRAEIFNEQKSKQIAEMQTKYETEKKEKEAEIYRLKNVELATANEVIRIKNQNLEIHEEQLKLINKIIRHDIINNLAVINSAIALYIESEEKPLLDEALLRVDKSIKLINKMREHESLIASEDLKFIDLTDVIKKILINYPDMEFTIMGQAQVLADDAIDSVIDNIINNALLHSGTNKIAIEITSSDNKCSLRIADYGIGIPDDIKNKIFDEGFIYGKKGHTGVGLYIVKESVKRWGGDIIVENNEPKGTAFILHFQSVR